MQNPTTAQEAPISASLIQPKPTPSTSWIPGIFTYFTSWGNKNETPILPPDNPLSTKSPDIIEDDDGFNIVNLKKNNTPTPLQTPIMQTPALQTSSTEKIKKIKKPKKTQEEQFNEVVKNLTQAMNVPAPTRSASVPPELSKKIITQFIKVESAENQTSKTSKQFPPKEANLSFKKPGRVKKHRRK